MEPREEGTTSLSKTSVEKVVVAALRDGRRESICCPDSRFDIDDQSTASWRASSIRVCVLVTLFSPSYLYT